MKQRLKTLAAGLCVREGGSVASTTAIMLIPLFVAAGASIDYGRWQHAQSELRIAMDAAVLAGTRALQENGGDEKAAIKVAESFYADYKSKQTDIKNDKIVFKLNDTKTGIYASGSAEITTSFMALANINTMPLVADNEGSAAEIGGGAAGDLEISLMLDVTGSMCDDGVGPCTSSAKLDALKSAAVKLIDTVVWQDQSKYTSKVAIVPFSTRVRVAQDGDTSNVMNTFTGLPATWSGWYKMCTSGSGSGGSEDGGNWSCSKYQTQSVSNWKVMPCVTDRFYNSGWTFDLTEDAPNTGKFLNAHDGSRMIQGPDSSSTKATSAVGAKKADPATHWNYDWNGTCYDVANANQVLPLSNDATALKAKINGLEAYGSTAGALGTAFAWYALSPNWTSVWGGNSAGKNYNLLSQTNANGAPKLRKIAILMSDGAYNTYRGWKDQDQVFVSNAAKSLCTNMKAQGIEIFTVAFALDNLTVKEKETAKATMQACGTDVEHFYESIDIDQLTKDFEAIGNKVSSASVRLTK